MRYPHKMQRREDLGRKPAGADQEEDGRSPLPVLNAASAVETAVLNTGPPTSGPTACGRAV